MKLPFKGTYPLSQGFGLNPQYYSQFFVKQPDGTTASLKGHNGIDYALPTGTEVIAPHSGKIIEATYDEKGYGNYVKLEDSDMGSVLAHLEHIDVSVGQEVEEGQLLGTSDNTGYSTGAHLHWGWYKIPRDRANGYGGFEDQASFILDKEPVSGQLHTQEEYDSCMNDRNKFWQERDEEIKKHGETQKLLDEANGKLTSFAAMGYATIDDINKRLDEDTKTIQGLQTEIQQVLDRNAQLAAMVASKEKEDSTAIDSGRDAQLKVVELERQLQMVAKEMQTEPVAKAILSKFDALQKLALWGEKFLKNNEVAKVEQKVTVETNKSTIIMDIYEWFGLKGGV